MDLHQLGVGDGPDDPHGVQGAVRSLLRRPVIVWAVAVAAFAALHAIVLVGASYWRYLGAQRAWPQTQAVLAQWDADAAHVTAKGLWGGEWTDLPAPALDLDGGAVITQVLASSASFAVLLGAALVVAAHGHRRLAWVGAVVPAVSVAAMGGLLARIAPMIPVPGGTSLDLLNLDMWPPELRQDRIDLDRAMAATDTPVWWNAVLAVVVATVALLAVRRVLRLSGTVHEAASGRPAPWRVGLAVGALAVATSVALVGDGSIAVNLALVTGLSAFVLAAAAACTSAFVVTVLTLGVGAAHWAMAAAFDRSGGAPGGWGIGTSGAQSSWTVGSTVALLLAPLAGWAVAEVWARASQRAAGRPTTTSAHRSHGHFPRPEPTS